jgi:hypothetical protein
MLLDLVVHDHSRYTAYMLLTNSNSESPVTFSRPFLNFELGRALRLGSRYVSSCPLGVEKAEVRDAGEMKVRAASSGGCVVVL